MDGGGAVVLLVILELVTAFNLDVNQTSVWSSTSDANFGIDVVLRSNRDGEYSLFVAAVSMTPVMSQGRTTVKTTWFQCSISEVTTCKHDVNFTLDNSNSNTTGISLKTTMTGNEERKFEVELLPEGNVKLMVYKSGVPKTQLWSSEEVHAGGSYGKSWCIADLNKDGWDDLIVGEPLHSPNSSESGRVFIHLGQKDHAFSTNYITGKNLTGAHFGSSISCIGDVDLDGYPDLAVGAPGESEGGAIYIYRGSAEGIDKLYSQHITAADVQGKNETISIRGFGAAISEGVDTDSNHYNDVAVGASQSGHVVLLKARPVVHLHASLNASTAEVDNRTTTFNLTYTLTFNTSYDQSPLDVKVVLQADTLQCRNDSAVSCKDKPDGVLYSENKTVSKNGTTTETIPVTLKRGVQLSPKPIEVKLSYNIVDSSKKGVSELKPVVDPKDPKEKLLKINHTLSCGNHTCRTELKLRAELDNTSKNVADSETTARINVSVENHGEPAFLTVLTLEAPPNISLVGNTSQCDNRSNVSATHLECLVGNPLILAEGPKRLILDLNLKNVTPVKDFLQLNFSVTSAGEEIDRSDNTQTLQVKNRITAAVNVSEDRSVTSPKGPTVDKKSTTSPKTTVQADSNTISPKGTVLKDRSTTSQMGSVPEDRSTTSQKESVPEDRSTTSPKGTSPESGSVQGVKSSSSSRWITGVVGGIVVCALLTALVFAIVKRRSTTSYKKRVHYKKVGASEFARFLPDGNEDTVSLENESYEDRKTPPRSLVLVDIE